MVGTLPGDVDVDLFAIPVVIETLAQSGPLKNNGRDEKIERDSRVSILEIELYISL